MDIQNINRLIENAALAAEPNLLPADVLKSVPTIECLIEALKGGRPSGNLSAVSMGFAAS